MASEAAQPIKQGHANQVETMEKILTTFRGDDRYVLLMAEVQSGKTGTYQLLIRAMFEEGMIDAAYVLCGTSDVELRDQAMEDVEEWHGNADYYESIHVLFRQDFKKRTLRTERILAISDESHLDCKKDQELSKFLGRHGLHMAGTTKEMVEKNIYILSVDATPFTEESIIAHRQCLPKKIVRLYGGEMYYGPAQYYRDGLIRPTFDVTKEAGQEKFRELLRTFSGVRKYILLRITEKRAHKTAAALETLFREQQIPVLRFTSEYTKELQQVAITRRGANGSRKYFQTYGRSIPCLQDQPETLTVVIVDGRLRCGKRTPKQWIAFTWSTADGTKTDVAIQELPGRMSGYLGLDAFDVPMILENRPLIFVSPTLFRKAKGKVVEGCEWDRYVNYTLYRELDPEAVILLPRKGSHLLPGTLQRKAIRELGDQVYPTVPAPFHVVLSDAKEDTDLGIKELCLNALIDQKHYKQSMLSLLQREEIERRLETLRAEDCRIRYFQKNAKGDMSQQSYFKQCVASVTNQCATREHLSDFPFLTFCVVQSGFKPAEDFDHVVHKNFLRAGTVFAIFYTRSVGIFPAIDIHSRIPKDDGKTHFRLSADEKEEMKDCMAAGLYGFSKACVEDPALFEKELSFFITLSQSSLGTFGCSFHSLIDGQPIRLSKHAYRGHYSFKAIQERMYSSHNVKLILTKSTHTDETYHCLDILRWICMPSS